MNDQVKEEVADINSTSGPKKEILTTEENVKSNEPTFICEKRKVIHSTASDNGNKKYKVWKWTHSQSTSSSDQKESIEQLETSLEKETYEDEMKKCDSIINSKVTDGNKIISVKNPSGSSDVRGEVSFEKKSKINSENKYNSGTGHNLVEIKDIQLVHEETSSSRENNSQNSSSSNIVRRRNENNLTVKALKKKYYRDLCNFLEVAKKVQEARLKLLNIKLNRINNRNQQR